MNKNEQNRKTMSQKGFYVVATLAFCAIIATVFAIRYTSKRLTNEITNLTSYSEESDNRVTDAQNEVSGVPDTRMHTAKVTPEKETTKAEVTEKTTQAAKASTSNSNFIFPLKEAKIAKGYYPKSPVFSKTMGDWRPHGGIDFEADEGQEVLSVGNGVVTKVVSDSKWGYVIEVDHGAFTARYCSIDQENAVAIGTELKCGDVIGFVSTVPIEGEDEPHLHFEAIKNEKTIDPLTALEKLQ